jgi:hypothetical protein
LQRLDDWQESTGKRQRDFAREIGRHESELSMLRSSKRRPSSGFMAACIAAAPEPWKSALKQARLADIEAADAAVAVA